MLRRLERQHGRRAFAAIERPLDVLVRQMLAQNTSWRNAAEGFRRLKRDLPTWQAVLDAEVEQVRRAIGVCGLGAMRARRLQALLGRLVAERGRLSLAFVGRMSVPEARTYLMSFHGIGPKTVDCTLLFAFGMPVFPVDKGIWRLARRLRIVPAKASEPRVATAIERATVNTSGRRYALHVLMYEHAKEICRPKNPKCDACRLLPSCPYGQRRLRHLAEPEAPRRGLKLPARWVSAGLRRLEPDD
jgi:endonuclease-3